MSGGFEKLEVWKHSARLSVELYQHFDQHKDYGFRDQITRSGLSVPSNIAEGVDRGSNREAVRFMKIAKGSCAELRTQIYIGMKIGYIPPDKGNQWVRETKLISAMLTNLIKKRKENQQD